MKKKIIITIIVIALLILLIPIPIHLKDGGSVEYKSLIYKVTKVHCLNMKFETEYDNGIIIEIFGFEIYNDLQKNNP